MEGNPGPGGAPDLGHEPALAPVDPQLHVAQRPERDRVGRLLEPHVDVWSGSTRLLALAIEECEQQGQAPEQRVVGVGHARGEVGVEQVGQAPDLEIETRQVEVLAARTHVAERQEVSPELGAQSEGLEPIVLVEAHAQIVDLSAHQQGAAQTVRAALEHPAPAPGGAGPRQREGAQPTTAGGIERGRKRSPVQGGKGFQHAAQIRKLQVFQAQRDVEIGALAQGTGGRSLEPCAQGTALEVPVAELDPVRLRLEPGAEGHRWSHPDGPRLPAGELDVAAQQVQVQDRSGSVRELQLQQPADPTARRERLRNELPELLQIQVAQRQHQLLLAVLGPLRLQLEAAPVFTSGGFAPLDDAGRQLERADPQQGAVAQLALHALEDHGGRGGQPPELDPTALHLDAVGQLPAPQHALERRQQLPRQLLRRQRGRRPPAARAMRARRPRPSAAAVGRPLPPAA